MAIQADNGVLRLYRCCGGLGVMKSTCMACATAWIHGRQRVCSRPDQTSVVCVVSGIADVLEKGGDLCSSLLIIEVNSWLLVSDRHGLLVPSQQSHEWK